MKKTLLLLAALFASTAHAGIVDGQPVDAAVTNAAFINKNTNDTTPSTLGLANTLTASGGSVTNLQAQVNAIDSFSGVVPNSAYNVKPVWSNNNVGTSTDSLKARVDTLSGLFFSGPVLPISNGGTGQTTASAAFNALSPMSALGDLIVGGSSPAGAGTRLSGNTTTTKMYLSQTGTGSVSAAPVWAQVAFADLSGFATIAQGGTNSTTALSNNRVMVSVSGQIVEQSALTASAPMRTDGSGLPTTGQTSLTTEVSGILPIANGGTNASSASGAFNNLSPVTLLGDLIYGSGALTNARLAGNTSSTKQFLTQTGTGSVSAAPVWGGIVSADLPTITLTSDVTGSGSGGSIATTLKNTGTAGTYTKVTTDAQGRVSSGTSIASSDLPSISVTGDATGSGSAGSIPLTLATVNSNVGSFTSANITVNAKGLVTAAANGSGGGSTQPAGTVLTFAGAACPTGTVTADGASLSTTGTYASLFSALGYTYGGSGGSFSLPDYQGLFLRGNGTNAKANGGSPAQTANGTAFASAALGTLQNDMLQGHFHGTYSSAGAGRRFGSTFNSGGTTDDAATTGSSGANTTQWEIGGATSDGTNGTPRTGAETRPANLSVLYCIWF